MVPHIMATLYNGMRQTWRWNRSGLKVQKWAITAGRETGVTNWSLVSQVKISYGKRDAEGSRIGVGALVQK